MDTPKDIYELIRLINPDELKREMFDTYSLSKEIKSIKTPQDLDAFVKHLKSTKLNHDMFCKLYDKAFEQLYDHPED